MAFESEQDRQDQLEALGESFVFTHNGNPHVSSKSVSIYGIFDRPYIETNKIEGYKPVVTVSAVDVLSVAHGAMVRHDPDATYTDYKVVGIEPDGTGMTMLILEEQ